MVKNTWLLIILLYITPAMATDVIPIFKIRQDLIYNSGGIQNSYTKMSVIDTGIEYKINKNNTVLIEGEYANGTNPNQYIGDLQGISNITADDMLRLYKAFYKYKHNNITLRFGLMDINDYFDTNSVTDYFLSPSAGFAPTIAINLTGIPAFPLSSLGFVTSYAYNNNLIMCGIFGGNGEAPFQNIGKDGITYALELDHRIKISNTKTLIIKLGYWRYQQHQNLYQLLGPTSDEWYSIGEYKTQVSYANIDYFIQVSGTPQTNNSIPYFISGGVKISRFSSIRSKDIIDAGVNYINIRNQPHAETQMELNYVIHVDKYVNVIPDVQYILHPGGCYPNSLVTILRIRYRL